MKKEIFSIKEPITMQWVKTSEQKPHEDANIEYSDNGIEVEGTMDYKCNRQCMMAGSAGGHGYFSSLGFATDGEQGEDRNLICDDPEYWRYWDEDDIAHHLTKIN